MLFRTDLPVFPTEPSRGSASSQCLGRLIEDPFSPPCTVPPSDCVQSGRVRCPLRMELSGVTFAQPVRASASKDLVGFEPCPNELALIDPNQYQSALYLLQVPVLVGESGEPVAVGDVFGCKAIAVPPYCAIACCG